ncbi:MAG: hypothetical protein JW861_01915 [Bacteroidales bacterium]|nr:hypothetical protein [Bacteroidales bacterium]
MRRLLSIIAILVVLLQSACPLLVLQVRQTVIRSQVRDQIRRGVNEKDIVLIKVPWHLQRGHPSVFRMVAKNEFRYFGRMYDVVRTEERGQTIWFYCIPDDKETACRARMNEIAGQGMDHRPLARSIIQNPSQLLSTYFHTLWHPPDYYDAKAEDLISRNEFPVTEWIPETGTPPPKS